MEGHLSRHRNYMAYPYMLNSQISQDMLQLRDSTVSSSRIFYLSRYVRQQKHKNSVFPFSHDPYDFIIRPNNYSNSVSLLQFTQNSSFFISYLQENPEALASVTFSIRRQWRFTYLINCIIPSLFGYFACHEYAEYAINFYSEIIKKASPPICIQIIQPFFHSCVTYHFFDSAYGSFIYSILVDKNILKTPDTYVSAFIDLLIECIKESMKYLPNEFFKLLNLIQQKNWSFEHIKSLIVDHFLIPELKIWSSRLDINPELKNFLYRIIDMISISLSQDNDNDDDVLNRQFSSFSCSMNFEPLMYLTDSSSSSNLSSLSLGFDLPVQPEMTMSRSTSILKPSKRKSQKVSDESRKLLINMKILINSFFISLNQNHSVYEMIVLYENFTDEIFPQCANFVLSIYDVQFLASQLEKIRLFPSKISSSVFINDSVKFYYNGIFYCHVYSHHIKCGKIQPFFSLFKDNDKTQSNGNAKVKFNLSLVDNDLFIKFLKFNKHYSDLFESYLVEVDKNSISEENDNIDHVIAYKTLMNEIKKQNDKLLYYTSFLIESFADQIINEIKSQRDLLKTVSFIKEFKKISVVFDSSNMIQMKKILYLKFLDLIYIDLIGDYWRVLLDFGKYWEELVHKPHEKKNLIIYIGTQFCFLPYFVNSTELLSQLDHQSLQVKYFIMIYAFNMLSHISKKVQNPNEVYEMLFQKIRSKEFMPAFLILDSMAMKIDVFQSFCTKEELDCWNHMKKNIDTYLNQNEQYRKVYLSITEYLTAVSTSLLYNTRE